MTPQSWMVTHYLQPFFIVKFCDHKRELFVCVFKVVACSLFFTEKNTNFISSFNTFNTYTTQSHSSRDSDTCTNTQADTHRVSQHLWGTEIYCKIANIFFQGGNLLVFKYTSKSRCFGIKAKEPMYLCFVYHLPLLLASLWTALLDTPWFPHGTFWEFYPKYWKNVVILPKILERWGEFCEFLFTFSGFLIKVWLLIRFLNLLDSLNKTLKNYWKMEQSGNVGTMVHIWTYLLKNTCPWYWLPKN